MKRKYVLPISNRVRILRNIVKNGGGCTRSCNGCEFCNTEYTWNGNRLRCLLADRYEKRTGKKYDTMTLGLQAEYELERDEKIEEILG
jgi:organic radical activating enzyme